jgi:hypothetical protein
MRELTGQISSGCDFTGIKVNQQVTAMAIDSQGRLYVAGSYAGDYCIYGVNPETGAASLLTEWTGDADSLIIGMGIDPTTGQCFGILQARDENPYGYYFGEITGVPEPPTITLLLASAACLLGFAWRRRRAA